MIMNEVHLNQDYGKGTLGSYDIKIKLNDIGESDPIYIPNRVQSISILLSAAYGASAKFQYTMSPRIDVSNNAIDVEWIDGSPLTETTFTDVIFPCTAIRLCQESEGSTMLVARAQ